MNTFKNRPVKSTPQRYELWAKRFEEELREKALRLLQMRAGGRLSMFEAGQLYEICLMLGMKDGRPGKMLEQEEYWNQIVLSCLTEDGAKQALEKLLKNEKVLTRKEKRGLGANKDE